MSAAYTAIDANINRALEGIRVCEDVLRFIFHMPQAKLCKEMRHTINQYQKKIAKTILLDARDVAGDEQKFIDVRSELDRSSLEEIFSANIHRAMEATRVLEELNKLVMIDTAFSFQNIRFSLYQLEKDVVPLIIRQQVQNKFRNTLYALLDSAFVKEGDYTALAEKMIRGGASVVQLRMKNETGKRVLEVARSVSQICRQNGCIFILNDHPDIAVLAQADGIHLGQDDLPVTETRSFLPAHMVIGISTHSYEQARAAELDKPDYIAVGPLFDTYSKSGDLLSGIGVQDIGPLVKQLNIPVVGIGGISPGNLALVKEQGCHSFAVISALYINNTIEQNCRQLVEIIES